MGHRYYDPNTGRFLTKDPIGYTGGLNLYAYAGDNPANYVDPMGLLRVGNYEIANGTLAAGATTAGVMLLGGPVTWAVGGGWAVGAAYSYFVDRHSGMDSLGEGASGALMGWGGVTAAQAAGSAYTIWRASAGPSVGQGIGQQSLCPTQAPSPVWQGRTYTVSPSILRAGDQNAIYQDNLNAQLRLLDTTTPRTTPIEVYPNFVVVDGAHAARAALIRGSDVDVFVSRSYPGPMGPLISDLPIIPGSK